MSFYELLKTRRSIRKYTDEKVSKIDLDKILKAGMMSPASKSSNPWEFVVVEDVDMLQKLSECRPHGSALLAKAPLGIAIIADTEKSNVWYEDTSIATTIMQLQIHEMGLGSCWVQVYERMYNDDVKADDYVRELLNIPEKYGVLCILAVGHKAEEKRPFDESKFKMEKIHTEKFQK